MKIDSPAVFAPADMTRTSPLETRLLLFGFRAVLLVQFVLVFVKGFNWDEFLHFGQVYDLRDGRLVWEFQTLHARLFAWVPLVASDLITQIQIARGVMLGFELVTVVAVVALARHLVDRQTALLAGLVYMTSGAVLQYGFSFRPDPMVTAALMTALCLLVTRKLTFGMILATGVLIGLSGMSTIKSILYLPCFAGAAWMRLRAERRDRLSTGFKIAAIPFIAGAVFLAVFAFHTTGITGGEVASEALASRTSRFLGSGLFLRWPYTVDQFLVTPVLTIGLIMTVFTFNNRPAREKVFILGLLGPLLSLIFYRNTYPYFFVFLFAPLCVAVAPALGALKARYGLRMIMFVMALMPVALLVSQPYGLIARQRAQIDEIHRLFPQPVGYLAYSSFVPDYPRIIPNLISGLGLKRYHDAGTPVIGDKIAAGEVAFVLADSDPVTAGLRGERIPQTLQEKDFVMLHGNFLHYVEAIWLSGKLVCRAQGDQSLRTVRPGPYTLDGGSVTIDGMRIENGQTVALRRGTHSVRYAGQGCVRLWNLREVPRVPAGYPAGPTMEGF